MSTTKTTTTITIQDACSQLGLSESDLRILLEPLYNNASTIKRISMKNFRAIAQSLQEAALSQPENENVDPDLNDVESEPLPQTETQIEPKPEVQEQYVEYDLDTEPESEPQEDPQPEPETSDLTTTENTDLTEQEVEQKIKMQLDLQLSSQVLNLNKISRALAVVAADETVQDFKEIYTHRVNSGINSFISDFAQQTVQTIEQLRASETSDFLDQVGKFENHNGLDATMTQIMNLI